MPDPETHRDHKSRTPKQFAYYKPKTTRPSDKSETPRPPDTMQTHRAAGRATFLGLSTVLKVSRGSQCQAPAGDRGCFDS